MQHCDWPTTIFAMLLVLEVFLGPADEKGACAAKTSAKAMAKLYCDSFGKKNTMCRYYNKKGCKKVSIAPKINKKIIKEIVHEHNRARQRVANGRDY